jgi:prevent-host-death family protein
MKSFTAAQAKRCFGEMLKIADDMPLEITRHGRRRRYVLMSAHLFEAYEYVRHAHAEDRVLVTTQSALGKLLAGEEEKGFKQMRIASAMMARFLAATGEKL